MKKQLLAAAFVFGALGCAFTVPSSQPTRPTAELDLVLRCLAPVVAGRRAAARPRGCDVLYWTNLRPSYPMDRTRPVPPGLHRAPPPGRGGLLPTPVPLPYWAHMLAEVA